MTFGVISKAHILRKYGKYPLSGWNGAYSITNLHPRHVLWGSRTWIAAVCIGRVICKGVDVMEICNFGGGLCPQKSLNWCLTTKVLSRFMQRSDEKKNDFRKCLVVMFKPIWRGGPFQLCSANCKQTQLLLNEPYAAIVFPSAVSTAGCKFANWLLSSFWWGGVKRGADIWSCLSHLSFKLDSDQSFLDNQNSSKYVHKHSKKHDCVKSVNRNIPQASATAKTISH